MNEREWVKTIIGEIEKTLQKTDNSIFVIDGKKLSYTNDIQTYSNDVPDETESTGFETDILIYEQIDEYKWKPRVVIETKLGSVTTHDAITYSQKAQMHKFIHPYLRYGILIGKREAYPLPGRLFRHGQHFDFMLSWKKEKADGAEMKKLIAIIKDEITASRNLEEILFNSRIKSRKKYTVLHRPLILDK